jgi:uncharacterized protein Yka (UPF0111/DUF47 family)
MSSENEVLIVGGVVTLATNALTWLLSKRKYSAETDNVIAEGADKIVQTSNNLLEMIQLNLTEERNHRTKCEMKVSELEDRIKQLESK